MPDQPKSKFAQLKEAIGSNSYKDTPEQLGANAVENARVNGMGNAQAERLQEWQKTTQALANSRKLFHVTTLEEKELLRQGGYKPESKFTWLLNPQKTDDNDTRALLTVPSSQPYLASKDLPHNVERPVVQKPAAKPPAFKR